MKRQHLNIKGDKVHQILICNTNRKIKDYLKSMDLRYGTHHNRKPNYVIDKKGKIILLNKNDITHEYLRGYHKDRSVIVICLENRGWLKRRSKDGKYVDWLGDIYDSRPNGEELFIGTGILKNNSNKQINWLHNYVINIYYH